MSNRSGLVSGGGGRREAGRLLNHRVCRVLSDEAVDLKHPWSTAQYDRPQVALRKLGEEGVHRVSRGEESGVAPQAHHDTINQPRSYQVASTAHRYIQSCIQ